MWALITGASSGIGRDMARYLYKNFEYNLILVARNKEKLESLKQELEESKKKDNKLQDIIIIEKDLSKQQKCKDLYEETKNINIDFLINNAGFGEFGEFVNTDLEKEIDLINTNITAVHILTKIYLKEMVNKNSGHILNVSSIAGMEPGPLMAAYYASKAYVIRLTRAINKELKKNNLNIKMSILCPGPVNTNFNNVANVVFKAPSMSSEKVAKYGIDKALKGKLIIIPGLLNKCVRFFAKILPDTILEEVSYHIQRRKGKIG